MRRHSKTGRLWGRMPSCAAVANRRAVRLAIGPQLTKLPHEEAS